MNDETVAALNRINRRFYSQYADAFDATRSRPWPGWERAIASSGMEFGRSEENQPMRSILDVGCGNGRFGEYLGSRWASGVHYYGVDDSEAMLRVARRRLARVPALESDLRQGDLLEGDLSSLFQGMVFQLIAVFGVLHHVPGFDRRQRLLMDLREMLVPGGTLLLSFWQFGNRQRFSRRFLDWTAHTRGDEEAIDLAQLEDGDHLLAWGDGESPPARYCHFCSDGEAERLVGSLGLERMDSFRADGGSKDLNLYFVLRNPA